MLPISVCMIAKNEELHVKKCLQPLAALGLEIILVDTGSTDSTIEIASTITPHIHSFTWCDDFAAARNFAISKASHDWILSVDCDEYLQEHDAEAFRNWLNTFCNESRGNTLGQFTLLNMYDTKEGGSQNTEHVTRLFNRRYYKFEGAVHEQLTPLTDAERCILDIPLTFLHMGYATKEIRTTKANRNISLLLAQIEKEGPSPYLYYQLGQCYFSTDDFLNAASCYETAFEMVDYPFPHYVQTMMEYYGNCLLSLKKYEAALSLLDEPLYSCFSNHADFLFLAGLICMNNALFDRAIEEFLKATECSNYRTEGANSYLAFYNIGVIYECLGNLPEAIAFYQKCEQYGPALTRLTLHENKNKPL